MQIAQAGIARSEIVNRKLDAEFAQLFQHSDRVFGVFHHRAFRDFELQTIYVNSGFIDDFLNLLDEIGMREMFARQIDADY